MAVARGALQFLLAESLRRPLDGRLLTLGKMDIMMTEAELDRHASDAGVRLASAGAQLSPKSDRAARGYLSDTALFARLGFSEVTSTDASTYEGADVVFDMNEPFPPTALRAFDVVLDAGTIEHVFHLPNVFSNIHSMVRPGGRVIHVSPSSNHVDHGFYMFSPTLFVDYYAANGYELNRVSFFRYRPEIASPWKVWDYWPGRLDRACFGGLDGAMYGVAVVATRTPGATSGVVPQQNQYRGRWLEAGDPAPPAPETGGWMRAWVRAHPRVHALIRRLRAAPRRQGLREKPDHRY